MGNCWLLQHMWTAEKADSNAAWGIHSTPLQSLVLIPSSQSLGQNQMVLMAELAAEMLAAWEASICQGTH